MFVMSSSMILSSNLIFSCCKLSPNSCLSRNPSKFVVRLNSKRSRRLCGLVPYAKKNSGKVKKAWWQRLFSTESQNWFGEDDGVLEGELQNMKDEEVPEEEKFEAWKRRAEAIMELREAQVDMRNEEGRRWEDWLVDDVDSTSSWEQDWDDRVEESREDVFPGPGENDIGPGKGLAELVRNLILGREDDDILYEDRVFQYASLNSAKFLAVLIIIPWALDFVVHDYVLMPFLDRYVKIVPLAAEVFDVRREQKLEIVKELDADKARYRLEVEIGKSPPLSDEDLWLELREKALELREELRLENRRAFANIWSDMVFGISLFVLLYFNQSKVALLKFSGYKILNNVPNSWKALTIIAFSDTLLGYHSELGWRTVIDSLAEHYGLQFNENAVTLFICTFPLFTDGCIKIWIFRELPKISPELSKILTSLDRRL